MIFTVIKYKSLKNERMSRKLSKILNFVKKIVKKVKRIISMHKD